MAAKLVFLHIPKTAGSSLRLLLKANYGVDDVFWYERNSQNTVKFRPDEARGCRIVGGHRRMQFYLRSATPLFFTSVVREPVARAVSLFNLYSTFDLAARERWMAEGLRPDSMLATLKECPRFSKTIENGQCAHLSGTRSCRKTLDLLLKLPCAVGVLDYLDDFTRTLGHLFRWPVTAAPHAHPAYKQGYRQDVLAERGLRRVLEKMTREDRKLYDALSRRRVFLNRRDLPFYQRALSASPDTRSILFNQDDARLVRIDPPDTLLAARPGGRIDFAVSVTNGSTRILPCGAPTPATLHYYLLDADGLLAAGNRPCGALSRDVSPCETARIEATAKIPAAVSAGIYQLRLALVLENLCSLALLWPEHTATIRCEVGTRAASPVTPRRIATERETSYRRWSWPG
jgi:hypothetical protein